MPIQPRRQQFRFTKESSSSACWKFTAVISPSSSSFHRGNPNWVPNGRFGFGPVIRETPAMISSPDLRHTGRFAPRCCIIPK